MNWFRIGVRDGSSHGYAYLGTSINTLKELVKKVENGDYIRLDSLRYIDDDGLVKKWVQWDPNLIPSAYINPANIIAISQLKSDPFNTIIPRPKPIKIRSKRSKKK
jgi:hypothetical protein